MTIGYDDYRRDLLRLRDLPGQLTADVDQAKQSEAAAIDLAARAVSASDTTAANALTFVESQLAAARTALEPLGKADLIPRQIRASGGISSATRHEVTQAQHALAAAVNQVRVLVQAEIRRVESENDRLARAAAYRERLARDAAERAAAESLRRTRIIQAAAAGAALLTVLIVILVVSL